MTPNDNDAILRGVVYLALSLLIAYLVIAFAQLSLDVRDWSALERLLAIVIAALLYQRAAREE